MLRSPENLVPPTPITTPVSLRLWEIRTLPQWWGNTRLEIATQVLGQQYVGVGLGAEWYGGTDAKANCHS